MYAVTAAATLFCNCIGAYGQMNHKYVYIHTNIYIYIHMFAHLATHIYIYIHMNMFIHLATHTYYIYDIFSSNIMKHIHIRHHFISSIIHLFTHRIHRCIHVHTHICFNTYINVFIYIYICM